MNSLVSYDDRDAPALARSIDIETPSELLQLASILFQRHSTSNMPTLKQVTCSLELGPNNTKIKEYCHRYTDGGVEAFIAVPEADIPFKIHVASHGYIAYGLAAFVYMDGQYQCNRNKQHLAVPREGMNPDRYEVDFKFLQREEKKGGGTYIAREWTFAQLKTGKQEVVGIWLVVEADVLETPSRCRQSPQFQSTLCKECWYD